MTTPMLKLDDGGGIPNDCFPVRPLMRQGEYGDGAWLVAHRAEQRRRFKAIICARPKTYNTIKEERRKAEMIEKGHYDDAILQEIGDIDEPVLDGFFLLRHCNIEDPSDLCTMKINGIGLSEAKEEDFPLFENVVRINAAENMLPLECFGGFPALQELEVPLCGLRNVQLKPGDFPNLEYLDVSYNELSVDDLFAIGLLPKLRRLHASGNNLSRLPEDLSQPHIEKNGNTKEVFPRFHHLEILMLDDNKLSSADVFASLAGLRRLKILNLANNSVVSVPHLRSVAGKIVSVSGSAVEPSGRASRKSRRSRPNSSRQESRETVEGEAGIDGSSVHTSEIAGKVEHINAKMLELNRPDSAPIVCVESLLPTARSVEEMMQDRESSLPAPFHTLRCLDLSHNAIASEEGLLAVAAWPRLAELIVHDNPLTQRRSGDPPLLSAVLTDRLGVRLIRQKPKFKPRPPLRPEGRHRVDLKIPPVPRCDVEKLLAIAAPPEEMKSEPLPAIPPREEKGFFVTELQDEFAAKSDGPDLAGPAPLPPPPPAEEPLPDLPVDLDDFSPLFEGSDDPELKQTLPNNLTGTVKALEFMLTHPLTEVERRKRMDRPQPPMRHLQKKSDLALPPPPEPGTQAQRTLENMRTRKSTVEAPLEQALKLASKKPKSKSAGVQRDEAEKLLNDIQRKYNVVRSRSMKIAKQESKQNINVMIEEIRDQIRRNLEDEENS